MVRSAWKLELQTDSWILSGDLRQGCAVISSDKNEEKTTTSDRSHIQVAGVEVGILHTATRAPRKRRRDLMGVVWELFGRLTTSNRACYFGCFKVSTSAQTWFI